jgi:flagellar secretion chaperone FliS
MPQSSYLESKVMTAAAPRLQLMLIEGALRFARQADDALRRGDSLAAAPPLLRVLDIAGELLAGVRANKTELNQRLADLYWFVFRRVSQAKINSDAAALAEAMKILDLERQTWQLVCEKFAGAENMSTITGPHTPALSSPERRGKNASSWEA